MSRRQRFGSLSPWIKYKEQNPLHLETVKLTHMLWLDKQEINKAESEHHVLGCFGLPLATYEISLGKTSMVFRLKLKEIQNFWK